jgi:hypothetical protein
MKDKYYTPTIEEFHVGFEFEVNYGKNNWVEESLAYAPQVVTLPYMKLENIRVKYLDKEDIESLGFKSRSPGSDMRHYHYFKREAPGSLEYWSEVLIDFRWGLDDIGIRGVRGSEEGTLFKGSIKNISELKIILKQLGV